MKAGTPRTSRSFRQRLSRRVGRNESREDLFTELDERSQENIQVDMPEHVGEIMVFPEKRASIPPPLPEKPGKMGKCRDITYVEPLEPVSPVDYSRIEKGRQVGGSSAAEEEAGWVEQSPHLGHRSPGWRKRQSVLSYMSTGVWSYRAKRRWMWSISIGAGIVVVMIIGLLAGLLSRRQ